MKTPCKDCPHCGCGSYHDQCEKYQAFLVGRSVCRKEKARLQDCINYHRDMMAKIFKGKPYG